MPSPHAPIPPTERALGVPLQELPPELAGLADPSFPFPDDRFIPFLETLPLDTRLLILGTGSAVVIAGIVALAIGLTRNIQATLIFGAIVAAVGLGTVGWGLTLERVMPRELTAAEARRGGYLLDEGFFHWDGHRASWIPRHEVVDLFNKVRRPDSDGGHEGWYLTLPDNAGAWQIPGSARWDGEHVDRVRGWIDAAPAR